MASLFLHYRYYVFFISFILDNCDLMLYVGCLKGGWINGELRDGRVTEGRLTRAKGELVDKGDRRVS